MSLGKSSNDSWTHVQLFLTDLLLLLLLLLLLNIYVLVVVGHNTFILFIYFYVALRIEPKALHTLGECSTAGLQPQP